MTHRYFLCTLFNIITFLGFSQGLVIEKGFNDRYWISGNAVVAGNHISYSARTVQYENSYFSAVFVDGIDSLGNLVWTDTIFQGESNNVSGFCSSGDGGMYLAIVSGGCDVFFEMKASIWKIDADGSKTLFKEYMTNDYHYFSGLSLLENNHVKVKHRIYNGDALIEYDEFGTTIDSLSIPESLDFLQYTNASGYHTIGIRGNDLIGYDLTGNSSVVKTFSSGTSQIRGTSSVIYLTTTDSIFKFDSALNLITSENLIGIGKVLQLKIPNDSTVTYLEHIGAVVNLVTLNEDLEEQTIESFGINLAGQVYGDSYSNRVFVAATYALSEFSGLRTLLFRRNNVTSIVPDRTDAAVTDIEVIDQVITYVGNGSVNAYSIQVFLNVTVKNEGSFPIHSVWLNRDLGMGICNEQMARWYYNGLNILPGDSLELYLGDAGTYTNVFSGPTISTNICVYSSFVNGIGDLNVPNDELCEMVIHSDVGVEELTDNSFSVFPNPTSGAFTIKRIGNTKLNYAIYSVNGAVVQNTVETTSEEIELELETGVYFIRLSDEAGKSVVKRVVVN